MNTFARHASIRYDGGNKGTAPPVSIETVLKSFVASNEPGAIVLKGRWGVGKTYFWRHQVIRPLIAQPGKSRYSYVSLFGINSLAELKAALAFATDEFDREARFRHQRRGKLFGRLWRGKDWIRDWLSKNAGWFPDALVSTPKIGASLAKLYERAAFYLVRERIVCFDDIERHGKNLDIKDFLGLVSYLVDQRSCRVAVILNSEELGGDQTIWDTMREKVFDGELTYAPSISETVALGLSEAQEEAWYGVMRPSLEALHISNIRLVQRTAKFMRRALEGLQATSLQPETVEHMARALTILVYSVHGQGEGAPPVAMVMQSGFYDPLIAYMRKEKESQTEQEKQWGDLLENYKFLPHGALDTALLDMVEAGYPDTAKLSAAVSHFESDVDLAAKKEAWHQAWRLYHDTVSENGDEFVAAIERTWPDVSSFEHAANLQGMVRLLRLLGRAELATRFIQKWAAQRGGARVRELEVSELSSFIRIDDEEISNAAALVREAADCVLPLQLAFDTIKDDLQRYDDRAIESFASASAEEVVQVIDASPGSKLSDVIKRVLTLPQNPSNPSWRRASDNMQKACEILAARSPLNADRISNWTGIKAVPAPRDSALEASQGLSGGEDG